MSSLPLRKPAAPSSTLLKFLRAQAQGSPFFSANHHLHAPARHLQARGDHAAQLGCAGSTTRSMTSCAPSLEASLLPSLSSFFPRRRREGNSNASDHHEQHEPTISSPRPITSPHSSPPSIRSASTSSQGDNSHSSERWREWRSGLGRWGRLFGGKQRSRDAPTLQPNDLPQLSGFLDDGPSLGRVVRPVNELKLRCTEFDEKGNVTLTNGEFKKSELIAKVRLHLPHTALYNHPRLKSAE